ncbi:MAG: phosphatidylcholine synthase [Alphaproteobacteria bacterium]|nr:MAG: phosphatidylcholine synthase [Alphaproteobacteria bacterium]
MRDPGGKPDTPLTAALAFSVHVFTASGAVLALFALLAAIEQNWPRMFFLLGAALAVDGVDGIFARKLDVAQRLPRWSGDILDLVVDYLTYVFIPAFVVVWSGLLPPVAAIPCAVAILISGALYFADRGMKMEGNYFRGFPAVWNVPVFYLLLLRPDPWIAAAAIAALAAATFLPIPFVHPFRVARLRVLTVSLLAVWSVLAFVALLRDMMPAPWITAGLCAIALYFLGAGLVRRAEHA